MDLALHQCLSSSCFSLNLYLKLEPVTGIRTLDLRFTKWLSSVLFYIVISGLILSVLSFKAKSGVLSYLVLPCPKESVTICDQISHT